ncbi:MAG: cellulase family glycosylhydrolase [bacterium]
MFRLIYFSLFSLMLIFSTGCKANELINSSLMNKSESTNKFLNCNDFKFLWVEAEDTTDHSFYGHASFQPTPAGISPWIFAPPEEKEKLKLIASNGAFFHIDIKESPWHKEGHYIKYEVIIPEERNYSLYVRERIIAETSPVKWRFDDGKWHTVKDFKELPDSQDSKKERKLAIRWVKYGNISLSRGRHILHLVIEKNYASRYFKQIDVFVLAKDTFTPGGIIKPEGTIEQIELPSRITLVPDKIINERFHDFHRGIVFIPNEFVWLEKKYEALSKEIFPLMKDLGLTFTRFGLDSRFMYSGPNIFTSIHNDKILNWLHKNYKVTINNQEELENFLNSLNEKERETLSEKFYRFVKEKSIIIREPVGYNEEYMGRLDKILDFYNTQGIKVILCLEDVPRWLSSNPLDPEGTRKEHWAKTYWQYAPKDFVGYTNLWKVIIEDFTNKYPNIIRYWEVENEPEVPDSLIIESKHHRDSESYIQKKEEIYLKMYDAAVEAVLKTTPRIKIGGPAATKILCEDRYILSQYIELLVKHCAQNKKKLDFISWHRYSDEPITYKNEIQRGRQFLDYYGLKNTELIIDEWALAISPKINIIDGITEYEKMLLRIGDNNVNAAYAAAVLQTMIDSGLDQSVYQGIHSEGRDVGDFYPGMGLSVESYEHKNPIKPPRYIKRSIYYTFKMFSMLDNKRILVNLNNSVNMGAIATKSDDAKQINLLIWNYDITERKINRKVEINLPGVKKIKYDRYLIDSHHTLFGAEELEMVEDDVISDNVIELELETNSVTFLKINLRGEK